MFHDWRWWFTSDSGLKARVAIGVVIFAILAIVDLRRHGRSSRRWREYLFLLLAATLGVLYGTVNNLISSSISWEFFYYGKGLDGLLGPRVPPDPTRLGDQAMLMGMKAAGSAYLLVGVALLLANNPRRRRKQLPFGRLILPLFGVLAWSALFAVLLGWRGWRGGLAWTHPELRSIQRDNLFRPRHFLCAYGIHLGAYAGGFMGTTIGVFDVMVKRTRATSPSLET